MSRKTGEEITPFEVRTGQGTFEPLQAKALKIGALLT